ncbi:putative ribonuclease H protein [Vitis vinifera]|uniref:Putative ribonuclease H protein n=1 Tax=Vitis vinifera TaxID=29760 RepID=A0A438JKY6_VITVI|nr:putative ribonuclease H protein [Vitis vinifera]
MCLYLHLGVPFQSLALAWPGVMLDGSQQIWNADLSPVVLSFRSVTLSPSSSSAPQLCFILELRDIWQRSSQLLGQVSNSEQTQILYPTRIPIKVYVSISNAQGSSKKIRKLQRDFLWGGGTLERKAHLVKWEVVCVDKEKGGLGIRKLALLNKALLGRWIWRFAFEKENLWKKEILKETNWCWENIEFTVGNGTKIRFWTDHWCGLAALSQSFPQLYALVVHRNATVDEVWDPNFGQGGWNLSFIRAFNDWELDLVGDLLTVLRGYRLTLEEDSVTWKGGRNGKLVLRKHTDC